MVLMHGESWTEREYRGDRPTALQSPKPEKLTARLMKVPGTMREDLPTPGIAKAPDVKEVFFVAQVLKEPG